MEFRFKASGDRLRISGRQSTASGNANSNVCTFEFSEDYEGLIPFAVFGANNEFYTVKINGKSCTVPSEATENTGIVRVGVFATNGDAEDFKRIATNFVGLNVESGAYSIYTAPETPDIWEEYLKAVNDLSIKAENAKNTAAESLNSVKESEMSANLASISAEKAKTAAEAAENNAEKSAKNAENSEKTASKALADLLSMISSGDIVLAMDGVLPLSAIPATATQEIYVVSSEDELTELEAQKGDLAELVEEINGESVITKTWQCLGENAEKRENWVIWGTSYAVSAGNALVAENAKNTAMVNGHRIVVFDTLEEYELAVKEKGTLYLVGGVE